jgi:hypothetical protein
MTEKKKIGRPATRHGQYDPIRALRVGPLWDECRTRAKADGQKMSQFVVEALRRELDRRNAA